MSSKIFKIQHQFSANYLLSPAIADSSRVGKDPFSAMPCRCSEISTLGHLVEPPSRSIKYPDLEICFLFSNIPRNILLWHLPFFFCRLHSWTIFFFLADRDGKSVWKSKSSP